MTTRSFSVLIFAALLAMLVGCSGGGDGSSPVTPPTGDDPLALTGAGSSAETASEGGHTLWGMWQGMFDPETGQLEIVRLRHVAFHVNVTKFLQSPLPLGLAISINDFDPAAGWIDLDLTIKHPFPNSNLRGFDVRGIVMGAGNVVSAKSDPTLVFAAPDGMRLENADGYTRWWNAQEFTTPGMYGFIPGALGFRNFRPLTTLNPYKYFADPLSATDPVVPEVNVSNRGTFSTDMTPPELSRNYQLQFPIVGGKPLWLFQYAIDANWAPPTGGSPKPKPIDDFPVEANCPEAFHILVDPTGTTAYYVNETDLGGSLSLAIEVFDWGAPDNPNGIDGEITSIRIESETLFDNVVNVPLGASPGSQDTSGIYHVTVPYVHPTGLDDQEVLITVKSKLPTTYEPPVSGPVYPEDAFLAAYGLFEMPISNVHPQDEEIIVDVPNGGEEWQVGTDQTIEWSWIGDIPEVDIFLSVDSGATFPTTLIESLTNDGDWVWQDIPQQYVTDNARIKVASATDPDVWDDSDGNFLIVPAPASITVTSPNGGETWGIGSVQTIEWDWTGDIAEVDIDLSLDGGANYDIPLADDLTNTGEFKVNPVGDWPTDEARVRVASSADPGVLDESDDDFTIEPVTEPIIVLIPNGGEVWLAMTPEEITWTAEASITDVKIELSLDSGGSYTVTVVDSTPNDGGFIWDPVMPDAVGDYDRIKISDVDNLATYDESDADFIVLANPYALELEVPNGGEVWEAGSQEEIEWFTIGPVGAHVKLEYMVSFGLPETIIESTDNDGSYIWDPIPDEDSDEVIVIITSVENPFITDQSDDFFTIAPPQAGITVVTPNGGEMWEIGTSQEILWTSENVPGQVTIEYTLSDVDPPITIVPATDNTGAFMWDPIPGPPTDTARVIITSIDLPTVSDQSDDHFTIYEPKSLELTSPNGGENLTGGGTWDILWNYEGPIANIKLELSLDGGGTFPLEIVGSTECDGVYEWDPVASVNTDQAIVRVSDVDDPGIFDDSDAVFTITTVGDAITVVLPNGGEVLQADDSYEITWLWTGDMTNVKIELSTNSGGSYDTIIIDLTECDGSFMWDPIPAIDTTTARVKISDYDAPITADESDGDFTITTVTPPGWNPVPGLTQVPLTDPAPNQGDEPEDIMVFSEGANESRGEIVDELDDNAFWKYLDDYLATSGDTWGYAHFAVPLHKFDVSENGAWVFVTNANSDSFPNDEVNDPLYCAYTCNDNTTGDTSDGYWHLYGDTGDPDPDDLPWRRCVDFSCGVTGGLNDTVGYHLVIYAAHPDNPQPHDGRLLLGAWDDPYDPDSNSAWFLDTSTQGGGQGLVDDTQPGLMALAADDDTDLVFDDEPVVGLWVLDSIGVAQCHALAFTTGDAAFLDDQLDSDEYGAATPVDIEVAPAKAFDYQVTDPGFNWLVALLDNGDGTWSVGVWEFDYLADPVEFVEIDITDSISGTPMAVDVDGTDFEIHVLSDNAGTVEATVFAYTP